MSLLFRRSPNLCPSTTKVQDLDHQLRRSSVHPRRPLFPSPLLPGLETAHKSRAESTRCQNASFPGERTATLSSPASTLLGLNSKLNCLQTLGHYQLPTAKLDLGLECLFLQGIPFPSPLVLPVLVLSIYLTTVCVPHSSFFLNLAVVWGI
ncbi:hypothetical protein ElyMa_005731500 [Elysia marginata]|uniref:Uncharacterized protein n=1 Tax=Elysia marginata TaxID=1093978 RepID=A0AAV4FJA9_9GAST|nr:hypothetical protein ElyMa_005731500 [Elysia marginata]